MDIAEISAHLEIRQSLARYSRGVDRQDLEMLKSVYHPDAIDNHGIFNGRGYDFAEWLLAGMKDLKSVGQHQITNSYIEVDGDQARVESYYLAFHPMPNAQTGEEDLLRTGGRYLDLFEKRNGAWKVAQRVCTIDWSRKTTEGEPWEGQASFIAVGPKGRDASDALFNR